MALILHIDTASGQAAVSIASNGNLLQQRVNSRAPDHASWIHAAIHDMTDAGSFSQLRNIDAIAVVAGPGSYTGLRVGMATAKGLCYALKIPLINLNTLRLMASAIRKDASESYFFCPMLDARRLEVFTALYNYDLQEVIPPCAMILDDRSFANQLQTHHIVFSGNGSHKWKAMVQHCNAVFTDNSYSCLEVAIEAARAFNAGEFADVAYTDPIYLKEFYSAPKTMKSHL